MPCPRHAPRTARACLEGPWRLRGARHTARSERERARGGASRRRQYCNSNARCKGFSFGGDDERPGDEVTVTFKGGSHVHHDANWVSYVKDTHSASVFGHLHGAMKSLDEAEAPAVVTHALAFEGVCLLLAIGVCAVFWRSRRKL